MTQRYFEDFTMGERFRSPSRTLTDAHFLFFAGMTGMPTPFTTTTNTVAAHGSDVDWLMACS